MAAFSTSDRFAHLDPKDRDRLEGLSKLDSFEPGAEIVPGGGSDWLALIAAGKAEVRARRPDGEVVVGTLGPGDLIGEVDSFADLPEGLRTVAAEETVVRAVPKGPLKAELKAHRSLAIGLLTAYCRSISEKVRAANDAAIRLPPTPRPPAPAGPRPPHLSEQEAGWLAVLGQELEVPAGEVVVREGEQSRAFYVVLAGDLEVRKLTPEGEKVLATLGARDLFGFMAFVDGKPRSASVTAATPCRLAKVEADALDKAARLNFTVGFKFLGTLCGVLGRTYRDTARQLVGA